MISTSDAAMRLARAIVSDISIFNEDKIVAGLVDDTLFELLEPEIDEGLNLYKSRVSQELFDSTNFYYRAIVDVLVKSRGHIKSRIW